MQNLLRGRLLYFLLAGLVVALYAHIFRLGHSPSRHKPQAQLSTGKDLDAIASQLTPQRITQIAAGHPRLGLAISLVTLLSFVLTIAGFWFTLRAVATGGAKRVWEIPHAELPDWSLKELSRIFVFILMIGSLIPFIRIAVLSHNPTWNVDDRLWVNVSMLLLDGFVVLTVLTFAQDKAVSLWKATPGLYVGSWWRLLKDSVRKYVAIFPWVFLLLVGISSLAHWLNIETPVEPIQELIFQEERPAVFALTLILACGIGPLAEELFFRGVLYPSIRSRMSRWSAMFISGGLFAAIHTNPVGFLPIMVVGCLLAYLYEMTGTLLSPVIIHVLHNSLLMGSALIFRHLMSLAGG